MNDRNQFSAKMREVVLRVERGERIYKEEMMKHLEEFEMYYPLERSFIKDDILDTMFREMLEYFGG